MKVRTYKSAMLCSLLWMSFAHALPISTLEAVDSGHYTTGSSGVFNAYHESRNKNYITGANANIVNRSFFVFDLSNVETILGATLLLTNPQQLDITYGSQSYPPRLGYQSPYPSELLELYDVSTAIPLLESDNNGSTGKLIYDDLGSGENYTKGRPKTVSASDNGTDIEIDLNKTAIDSMNKADGLFAIGAALLTLDDTYHGQEYVFGWTNDGPSDFDLSKGVNYIKRELLLETVPEPSTLALLSIGLVGLGFTRQKMKA